ncbi:MAG: hypothetical protein PHU81_08795 [Acidobacteriota bacterium]|nr:hypothetical protein [Acidobacteriota bacterium]
MMNRWLLIPPVLLLVSLMIISCSGSAGQPDKKPDKKPENGGPGQVEKEAGLQFSSFLQKNQQTKLDPALAVARRDIFRPGGLSFSGSLPDGTEAEIIGGKLVGEEPGLETAEAGLELHQEAASLLEKLNLIYEGIIFSEQKALALLALDGQTLVLSEGEEIMPGLRLVKITASEVLIEDSQGNSRKIKVKENSDE